MIKSKMATVSKENRKNCLIQSPLQSCLSFLSSHTPLRWAIFKIYEETIKIIFQRFIRFKVIVFCVLNKFAPEETHIMAGIPIP
jgi:hypothetical protein